MEEHPAAQGSRGLVSGAPIDEEAYGAVVDRVLSRLRPASRRAAEERQQVESLAARVSAGAEGYESLSEKEKRSLKPWARLQLLWEASLRERYRDPKRMAELAFFASITARNLPPEVYGAALVADLQARAWAELANADRVNEHLEQADLEFSEARRLLKEGTGSPLVRARIADLEASLRRDQRRIAETRALLDEARRLYVRAGELHLAGRTLINKGATSAYEGNPHEAARLFRKGLALLDRERDPQLLYTAQLSLIRALAESREFRDAGKLLLSSGLREAFAEEPLVLLKLRWLEGTILAGYGHKHRAEEVFSVARGRFKEMGQEYDAALVGLELAELWLQQGKLDAVQELASDTLATFRRLRIDVHALAAVQFLAECCRRKILSAKILSHVRDFLSRFQENPYLRFEYAG